MIIKNEAYQKNIEAEKRRNVEFAEQLLKKENAIIKMESQLQASEKLNTENMSLKDQNKQLKE